ncbi:efflux RND transporter periplasmic adaptor subunit [Psychroflexus planctonicus]|uniref:RND family efflux transporter, MFP subunit n=1 Tax=Psychroflexus planctonicus TaxID=1526575 RepID=A0ABQ1SFR6_9FLAO|nr:HlyD family efflux transporter periplasmic adaptor subunit [Psychroflexus planctonicus]GGE37232.1 hypothetical protein GCM10010832_16800 [Psychroflexus planctonicus]
MRKVILAIIGLIIIALSIFGAIYLVKSNVKEVNEKVDIAKPISVKTVENKDILVEIKTNGSLTALTKFEIFSEVQGVFKPSKKLFRPGQEYRANEVLVNINSEEFLASLKSTKSEFINLLVSLMPDLRIDYPEQYKAWQDYLNSLSVEKDLPKLPEIQSESFNYFISGRGILTSYYNIKNLEVRLAKFNIRAPFTGILTEADITPGTLVRPGQRLGEFIDPEVMELEIALQKDFIKYIHVGDSVNLKALDNVQHTSGVVSRINSQVDPNSQTIQVFVNVEDENLNEGMYLEATIKGQTIQNAFELNRSLINNTNEVFVVKDSILALKKVQPLHFDANTAVVKGLDNGDVIMTSNLSSAYSGMLVKLNKN